MRIRQIKWIGYNVASGKRRKKSARTKIQLTGTWGNYKIKIFETRSD